MFLQPPGKKPGGVFHSRLGSRPSHISKLSSGLGLGMRKKKLDHSNGGHTQLMARASLAPIEQQQQSHELAQMNALLYSTTGSGNTRTTTARISEAVGQRQEFQRAPRSPTRRAGVQVGTYQIQSWARTRGAPASSSLVVLRSTSFKSSSSFGRSNGGRPSSTGSVCA